MNRAKIFSVIVFIVMCTTPAYSQAEAVRITMPTQQTERSYIAFKTNLLYDMVLVPNLGIEINTIYNMTIYGDLMFADWNLPAKHFYWNLFGAQAGIRKYFGRASENRSFTGHHAGIYAQALAYDLQAGNLGQQTPTLNLGCGVEYGYSFPISRSLNLDIEIGMGYLGGKYFEYVVHEDHYTWRGTIQRTWFGPTKASMSLVWILKSSKQTRR